jgi:hypothetical protein
MPAASTVATTIAPGSTTRSSATASAYQRRSTVSGLSPASTSASPEPS